METFISKSLGLKAHTAAKVEQDDEAQTVAVQVERVGRRGLRCGECGRAARAVAPGRRPARRWRDVALREHTVAVVYAPYCVRCPRCGWRVEGVLWAAKWPRVTHASVRAVAAHVRLNWKTVTAVVEGVVLWGLAQLRWEPLHLVGIDEVSRRKRQQSLTIVSDPGRWRVVWVGRDRTTETMERFLTQLGPRRVRAIHTACCDMWAPYHAAVRIHVPDATIVSDRFHLTQNLSRAVDEVRRPTWRQMQGREKAKFKRTRFLWLRNPANLARHERTRLSALLRLNSPIVKANLLKEDLRHFWAYRSTVWATAHLQQ